MFVDCHTHIIYNIDDGAKTIETSFKMIDLLLAQNASGIWLTPHFDASKQNPEKFIEKRDKAFKKIKDHYKDDKLFSIGSEALLDKALLLLPNLSRFCINGNTYMLIEFDTNYSFDEIIYMLSDLIAKHSINPIIAHIERYNKIFYNNKHLSELIEIGCLIQMNMHIFKKFSIKRFRAIKLIKNGYISLLGTDCHNMNSRPPEYASALKYIQNKTEKNIIERFEKEALNASLDKPDKIIFI